jgi:vancomycin resistance protein YoaR
VAPGEWFSFWETVGEVSEERGFGPGGAIINGRTEPTGAIAGGICSCSTTLFNAALRAGYEMGDRRNHFYYITRYPKGLDATVFRSDYTDQDMTWRNDTDYPVLIRGVNATGAVTFELYSVNPGRRVVLTNPIVKNPRPAKDTIEYTSELAPGQRERVEHPADGFDSWVTRTVYKGDTVIHQETYQSHYSRVDGVVRVGR